MEQHLHIVSFDVPFPPNYGGVIDVFYKIKALSEKGIRVHLHCFTYSRQPAPELEELCYRVYYYPRSTGWKANLSLKPYIVFSRRSPAMLEILKRDEYPVIFEGLHTCYYLSSGDLRGRQLIYRESNIEHQYYRHLSKAAAGTSKSFYFYIESLRLQLFQRVLKHASLILTVSEDDNRYLQQKFPKSIVRLVPSFHREDEVDILPGRGSYALYHGKLSVPENEQAAIYLAEKVWTKEMPPLVIAGMDPGENLFSTAATKSNVTITANPNEAEMARLVRNAHLHIMVTFQPTGLKLKLLKALYNGRFCLVNPQMLAGTSLHTLCHVATTPEEIRSKVMHLSDVEFTPEMIEQRVRTLNASGYSNEKNCKTLLELLTLST